MSKNKFILVFGALQPGGTEYRWLTIPPALLEKARGMESKKKARALLARAASKARGEKLRPCLMAYAEAEHIPGSLLEEYDFEGLIDTEGWKDRHWQAFYNWGEFL